MKEMNVRNTSDKVHQYFFFGKIFQVAVSLIFSKIFDDDDFFQPKSSSKLIKVCASQTPIYDPSID